MSEYAHMFCRLRNMPHTDNIALQDANEYMIRRMAQRLITGDYI